MKEKSKAKLGLPIVAIQRKQRNYFTDDQKHKIIQEVITSDLSKTEIWKKYTGKLHEHGRILKWMRLLGYTRDENLNFASNSCEMKKKDTPSQENESFESLQLKKRIEELEKQLKDAEMKAIAFSTMIDIAERDLKISIRKKANTKPFQK